MNRLLQSAAVALFVVAPSVTLVFGQLPIPVPDKRPHPEEFKG